MKIYQIFLCFYEKKWLDELEKTPKLRLKRLKSRKMSSFRGFSRLKGGGVGGIGRKNHVSVGK